jgi:hypothetical protein
LHLELPQTGRQLQTVGLDAVAAERRNHVTGQLQSPAVSLQLCVLGLDLCKVRAVLGVDVLRKASAGRNDARGTPRVKHGDADGTAP